MGLLLYLLFLDVACSLRDEKFEAFISLLVAVARLVSDRILKLLLFNALPNALL